MASTRTWNRSKSVKIPKLSQALRQRTVPCKVLQGTPPLWQHWQERMACWPRWQPDCSLVAQFVSCILWLMSVLCESHSNNEAILQKDEQPWPLTPGLKSVVSTGPQCRRKPLAFLVPLQKIQKSMLLCLNRVKKTKLIWLWNTASTYECVRLFSLLQCFATSCEVHLSSMDLSVPQKWMVPISSTVMVISSDMCWRLGPWRLGVDGSTSRNTKLDWTSKRLRHQHVFKWNYTKTVLRRMSNRFWDLFRDGLWIVVLLLSFIDLPTEYVGPTNGFGLHFDAICG